MTVRIELAVRLRLRSPFLFRDATGAAFGLDAAALRDAWGRPVLPGDQLRGVLREALEDIAAAAPRVCDADDLDLLFGRGSADARTPGEATGGDAFAPARGALLCADLVADGAPGDESRAVRVAIDADTGAARAGALVFAELCAPPAAELDFAGRIVVLAPPGREQRLTEALKRGIALVAAIGAQKTVGFGEVVRADLAETARRRLGLPGGPPGAPSRLAYRMVFDRPFLVDAVREADNLFVGSEVVPGAAVKGALARALRLAGEDPETGRFAGLLAATVVSHAMPENAQGVPAGHALPLSLVAEMSDGRLLFGDSLGVPQDHGVLFRGGAGLLPARYGIDWKDGWATQIRQRLGWPAHAPAGRELRVHTAISRATGASDEGRLFAFAARAHRHADPATGAASGELRGWRLTLDPPEDADPALWAQLVALLETGLDGIGRTGASASFTRLPEAAARLPDVKPLAGVSSRHAVVLTTAAVLTGADPRLSARDAYAAYWEAVLPGARLRDHAATQSLAGGYVAQRHRAYGAGRYVPFVLTDPGSVFLLEGADPGRLRALQRRGLPVPRLGNGPPDWRTCPFVPENGYGAFTADWLSQDNGFDEVIHV